MPIINTIISPESTLSSDDNTSNYTYDGAILKGDNYVVDAHDVITVTTDSGGTKKSTIYALAATQDHEKPKGEGPQPAFQLRRITATDLPPLFIEQYLLHALPPHLQPPNHISVVISTHAGTGQAPSFFDIVLQPILEGIGLHLDSYDVVRTENVQSVKHFARSTLLPLANKGIRQTIITLAGDGSVVDMLNGLLGTSSRTSVYVSPIIAQLPLGTGNALFHSLHRASAPCSIYVQGLRTLLRGQPKRLPMFCAKFSPGACLLSSDDRDTTPLAGEPLYGAIVASYGFHATLVADSDTPEYRKHGDKRFGLIAQDLLFPSDNSPPHSYKAEITLFTGSGQPEVLEDNEHGYVLVTLVSNLEQTFTVSPESKPLDGKLRLVQFGKTSGAQTMEIMKAAYQNGGHIGMRWEAGDTSSGVRYDEVEGIRVDFREPGDDWKWRRCCIDGLIVGIEAGGWMEVRKEKAGSEVVEVVIDV